MNEREAAELFKKEVLESHALCRIRWDPRFDPKDFTVRYLDRITGELMEVEYTNIRLEDNFLLVGESQIPAHRIREILYKGDVVWDKRRIE